MLQHNTSTSDRTHLTHAAVVALHALCCGLPVLALAVSAVSGSAFGAVTLARAAAPIHDFIHAHEMWVLGLSTALAALGAGLEVAARWGRQAAPLPWLFFASILCLAVNAGIIAAHRLGGL